MSERSSLSGIRVGISISESGEPAFGFGAEDVNRVTALVIETLLGRGARIVLGHDWRRDGVMDAVFDAARRYAPTGRGDWGLAEAGATVTNLLAWPDRPTLSTHEQRRWESMIRVQQVGGPPAALSEPDASDPAERARHRAAALTAMRRELVESTDARLCLGGRIAGFSGAMPGVLEELELAMEARQALYLSRLLGGVSAQAVEILEGSRDGFHFEGLRKDVSHARGLKELGIEGLAHHNGLDVETNRRLFRAQTVDEVIALVLRGLGRLHQ